MNNGNKKKPLISTKNFEVAKDIHRFIKKNEEQNKALKKILEKLQNAVNKSKS